MYSSGSISQGNIYMGRYLLLVTVMLITPILAFAHEQEITQSTGFYCELEIKWSEVRGRGNCQKGDIIYFGSLSYQSGGEFTKYCDVNTIQQVRVDDTSHYLWCLFSGVVIQPRPELK